MVEIGFRFSDFCVSAPEQRMFLATCRVNIGPNGSFNYFPKLKVYGEAQKCSNMNFLWMCYVFYIKYFI